MKRHHAALLVLILACAAFLRRQSGEGLLLTTEEARGIPSKRLIDDPDTCIHLRRIARTLGEERAPEVDAFLAHPDGAAYPWLPFYDTLLARGAELFLRPPRELAPRTEAQTAEPPRGRARGSGAGRRAVARSLGHPGGLARDARARRG